MSKYDVRVGFSGYFFQKYEVTASTEEEAREFITTVIQEEGWREAGAIENITSLGGNSDMTDVTENWLMEITDWDIEEMVKAD